MLAKKYDPAKRITGDVYVSEKLDGLRCVWDGGLTRWMDFQTVPFANRERDDRGHKCSGLWTRYGKPIFAPDWFLDILPKGICLDGELWLGRGQFQEICSVVKQHTPDDRWREISFNVFDSPSYDQWLMDGRINNPNFRLEMAGCFKWAGDICPISTAKKPLLTFAETYSMLGQLECWSDQLKLHPQTILSALNNELNDMLDKVVDGGGEGLMLRRGGSYWVPKRSDSLLKLKNFDDGEGIVIGYKWGRATDKGSKLLGLMGSLILKLPQMLVFDLSGFTDQERELKLINSDSDSDREEGFKRPGEQVSDHWTSDHFPIGSTVSFQYRGLTTVGLPREARYWRKPD